MTTIRKNPVLCILALVALAAVILLPIVFPNKYYTDLFCQVLINIIAVLGLNVVMGLAGQTNLGTIGIIAIGSYTISILSSSIGTAGMLGILLALAFGVALGLMLGYPSLRVKGVYLTLTTLSFTQIVYLLANNLNNFTGGPMGLRLPYLNLLGWQLTNTRQLYYVILSVTVFVILFSVRIGRSKFGRAFKAMNDNPEAVEALGIKISNLKLKSFMIATILGCLAGALYAVMMRYISPTAFIPDANTKYIIILLLGGIGSTGGIMVGAVIVTLLPEILRFMGDYYQLVFYVFALCLLLVCPLGLADLFRRLKNSILKKWRASNDAASRV